MIDISEYISRYKNIFEKYLQYPPWEMTQNLAQILTAMIKNLDRNYQIENDIAIHQNAVIEKGVSIKGPVIINEHCFIGGNAYLRGPVFMDKNVRIGPGCEIKQSILFSDTAIAHFNYVGDSIIGSGVNFEAGAIAANHYNEREDKRISLIRDGKILKTGAIKFGALLGDHCKIGANAVLSPGTLLPRHAVVRRLQLIDQVNDL